MFVYSMQNDVKSEFDVNMKVKVKPEEPIFPAWNVVGSLFIIDYTITLLLCRYCRFVVRGWGWGHRGFLLVRHIYHCAWMVNTIPSYHLCYLLNKKVAFTPNIWIIWVKLIFEARCLKRQMVDLLTHIWFDPNI